MYAIVKTGGKQYCVSAGDVIEVEKLDAEVGAVVVLDKVLLINADGQLTVGRPFVEGAGVEALVLENGKGKKVYAYKYEAKKDYKKKIGHRQPFTKLEIKAVKASGAKASAPAKKNAADDSERLQFYKNGYQVEEKSSENGEQANQVVGLKAMKKAELVDFAASKGIEVNAKLTKDEIIAAIEAAIK